MDGADGSNMNGASGGSSVRRTEAPAQLATGGRTHPMRSSGKYPLPGPWPEPPILEPEESQPFILANDEPVVPVVTREVAREVTREFAPRVTPRVTRKITRDLALEPAAPVVTRDSWLEKPEYWLADHQLLPRPRTRPVPRPKRFRRVSYARSAMLLVVILTGIFLVSAGMVFAGRLSYDFFNSPLSLPSAHPATSTTIPATATTITVEPTATVASDTATATTTGDEPTVTPIIPETPTP